MNDTTAGSTHTDMERLNQHRVVIVGGGAGGLELATRLGRHARPGDPIDITLVDASLTHLWKPLLHELAAGSLDVGNNELDYLAHAHRHGYRYQLGTMDSVDRMTRQLWLAELRDEAGQLIAPRRSLSYDTLVMAIGSQVNDFKTPGVREHAIRLNSVNDAKRLHQKLVASCLRADMLKPPRMTIAIIGAGATGVELASELRNTLDVYERQAHDVLACEAHIVLVEAGPTILSALPATVRERAASELKQRGVDVRTGLRVSEITAEGLRVANGEFIPTDLVIWAAGVKAPDMLKDLDGLETNELNQLVVRHSLQTTRDPHIFAFGDCASCVCPGRSRPVPPLAQAAHQQARFLARVLPAHVKGRQNLPAFVFHEHGSLISLGPDAAVGSLIGAVSGHRFFVNGLIARLTYWSLYRGYLAALHGLPRMLMSTLGSWLTRSTQYRVKLH